MIPKTIAIVGGGATGVTVFVQLVERLAAAKERGWSIRIIEQRSTIGPGLPYSTVHDCNILNQRSQKMSLFASDPDHFVRWMGGNRDLLLDRFPDFDPATDSFPPRSLYGLYVQDMYARAREKAALHGISVEEDRGEVVDVMDAAGPTKTLLLKDGRTFSTDTIIFTLGHFPPTAYKEFSSLPGYCPSPWPDDELVRKIPRDVPVLILGTRLSAIDAALNLTSNGHTGKLTMVSRGGLFPKVKQERVPPFTSRVESLRRKVLSSTKDGSIPLRLPDLEHFLSEELIALGGKNIPFESASAYSPDVVAELKKDIAIAEASAVTWHGLAAALIELGDWIWHLLGKEDKRQFHQKYGRLWFIFLATPLKNAKNILQLLECGQLTIAGGFVSTVWDDARKVFVAACGSSSKYEAPYCINTTDSGLDITQIDSPLLQNLLRSGTIAAHPYGGIDVDFKTCRIIGQNGVPADDLYFVGYLTRGVHFYTNDTNKLAYYVERVMQSLFVSGNTL